MNSFSAVVCFAVNNMQKGSKLSADSIKKELKVDYEGVVVEWGEGYESVLISIDDAFPAYQIEGYVKSMNNVEEFAENLQYYINGEVQ